MMRFNLGLTLLAIGLAIALLWPEPPLTQAAFPDLSAPAVQRIQLAAGDIVLQREADGWRLTHPINAPADPLAISGLLDLVDSPAQRSWDAAELDLAELALAPSRWSLQIDSRPIAVGRAAPAGDQRYVLVDGQVLLIPEFNTRLIDSNPVDLVDRQLLPDCQPTAVRWADETPKGEHEGATRAQGDVLRRAEHWARARAFRLSPAASARGGRRLLVSCGKRNLAYTVLPAAADQELTLRRDDWNLNYHLPASARAELLPDDA